MVDESNADQLRRQDLNMTPTEDNPVVVACVPDDVGEGADPVRESSSSQERSAFGHGIVQANGAAGVSVCRE